MKKIFAVIVLLIAFAINAYGQSNEVVFSGTIASGASKTFYVPLQKYMNQGIVDSVILSIYYKGVIKDSTLALTRGFVQDVPTYIASSTSSYGINSSYFGTADTTITPGITNTTYTYTANRYKWTKGLQTANTLKHKLDGFNAIKGVFLAKLTGNTATANTQQLTIIARVYWHKF